MVPSERGSVATAVSTAAADKLLHGPVAPDKKKRHKRAPRKAHKAEREKLKRDHLNDLFVELGNMLEEDRQSNGKACILADTTRILRDLLSQVESLRKENATLLNESHYVTMERNELQDETTMLAKEILELQNDLRTRQSSDPGSWGNGAGAGSDSASVIFPSGQPPAIPSTVIPLHLQQPLLQPPPALMPFAAPPPLELTLFPKPASDEASSEDHEASHNHVARPQARYPTQAGSWPVSLFPDLPGMEDEQCSRSSSSTTGSSRSREASTGRN